MGLRPQNPDPITSGKLHHLYVRVHLVGSAFHIEVEFRRFVSWPVTEGRKAAGTAATWSKGMTGPHNGSADYILRYLDELLDKFLNEYLKQNQVAQ